MTSRCSLKTDERSELFFGTEVGFLRLIDVAYIVPQGSSGTPKYEYFVSNSGL